MNYLPFLIVSFLQYASCLQERDKSDRHVTVYCVSTDSDRNSSTCHTLKYYIRNSSLFFKDDTTFTFHRGIHLTGFNASLHVSNVSGLVLEGDGAIIQCNQTFFRFLHTQNLAIRGLNFSQCGVSSTKKADGHPTLGFTNITGLELSNMVISRSEYQGILMDNSTENISITNSIIRHCQTDKHNKQDNKPANAIYFSVCPSNITLYVRNTSFLENRNSVNGTSVTRKSNTAYDYPFAGGLTVVLRCPLVSVHLENVTVANNSGGDGGNLAFVFHTHDLDRVAPVIVNNSRITHGAAEEGGGIFASLVQPSVTNKKNEPKSCNNQTHTILRIENTKFEHNSANFLGGAIGIRQKESSTNSYIGDIIIKNCKFVGNALKEGGHGGTAITSINFFVTEVQRHISPQFQTIVSNCSFHEHYLYTNKRKSAGAAVIFAKTNPYFKLHNIIIDHNNSSAIIGLQSNLVLEGVIIITNNRAQSGGGLLLCQNAVLYFETGLELLISDNHAEHTGGGIAVESVCMVSKPICFFQLASDTTEDYNNISVRIHNNSAKHAGDNLYGGSVDFCYLIEESTHNKLANKSLPVFNKIFDIYPNGSGLPYVTSPPGHACVCIDGSARCDIPTYPYPDLVYPGKLFNITLILAGQLDGSVPGLVEASLDSQNQSFHYKYPDHQMVRRLKTPNCTNFNYTIYSNQTDTNVTMVIDAAQQGDISVTEYLPQYRPLKVVIRISKCPRGFHIDQKGRCTCKPIFLTAASRCFISNQTIIVKRNAWIGYINNSDSFLGVEEISAMASFCPPEYCNPGQSYVNTSLTGFNQDAQCKANRRGIMCGQCKPGHSVTLGGTDCEKCSNAWLSLIVVYGFVGLLLVFLLSFFDITVADGTINGFIFYANVVQVNHNILFTAYEKTQWLTNVLNAFVGWISLGNGLERCFYDGMTEYQKAWIQFIFSFYIWLILGLIVILSRRYSVVMQIMGTNTVKVLATLILLSYSKLLLSIIDGVDATVLNLSNDQNHSVWTKDGNIHYLGEKHLPLFIFSVCLLIILTPFTISLLFIQILERYSHYRVLYLVRKFKPLLDAYTGPYTDNARFWTGFLLLIRILLFAISTFSGRTHSTANVSFTTALLFIVLTTAMFLRNGVYKKTATQILEGSLLLNLALVFVSTDYCYFHGSSPTPNNQFFVGIAFLTFIGVIAYHILRKIYTIPLVQKCIFKAKSRVRRRGEYHRVESHDTDVDGRGYLPPVVRFTDDREPLLASRSE